MKILVVDDDPSLQRAYQTIFSKYDWQVVFADNGKDGLVLAKSEKPDFIMLDMLMPQMGGVEFMEHFSKHKDDHSPVIFVLTNSEVPQDSEKVVKSYGAKEYILKSSLGADELVQLINKYKT
jgi:CheY-like chemotaxis protein